MKMNNKGFTLIELLVVVAIIGILAAIAIPQFAEYRARGFDARAVSDLRNAATGEEGYFATNEEYATCTDAGDCETVLPGYTSSNDVVLSMDAVAADVDAGTDASFSGESYHPLGSRLAANPYMWDSTSGGLQD